jgi:hypothetical protein
MHHINTRQTTGTRVHSVIFLIFIEIKYFPLLCLYSNLPYAESPNFDVFCTFWCNPFFSMCKYVKIRLFCIQKVTIEAKQGKIFNFNENKENHSVPECQWYKHNEQIDNQNIDNAECFGDSLLKSIQKCLHNIFVQNKKLFWLISCTYL